MIKFIKIFLLVFLINQLQAKDNKDNKIDLSDKNLKKIAKIEDSKAPPPFTKEMVEFTIKGIKKTVLTGKNNDGKTPLKARQLYMFSRSFDLYSKRDDIEKVTKVSQEWFAKCRDSLKKMYIPMAKMETARMNKKTKDYKQAEVKYKKQFKVFEKLIKNPEKAKKKKKKSRIRK